MNPGCDPKWGVVAHPPTPVKAQEGIEILAKASLPPPGPPTGQMTIARDAQNQPTTKLPVDDEDEALAFHRQALNLTVYSEVAKAGPHRANSIAVLEFIDRLHRELTTPANIELTKGGK